MESHGDSFCIKSVKPATVHVNIPCSANFDFAAALSSVYPLLECVFEYLPYNDLVSCSKVNLFWKQTVLKTLSRRKNKPSWITCYKVKSHKSRKKANVTLHSNNLNYNNVALGIILYDANRISMSKYVCVHRNTTKISRKTVPEYFEDELIPKSVDYCVLSVPKVVSSFDAKRTPPNVLIEASTFDGLFIPKIPNVRTVLFHCDPSKKSDLEQITKSHVGRNEDIRCLLIFCKKQLHQHLYSLIKNLIPSHNKYSVALGGGVIRGTKLFQKVSAGKKIYSATDAVCICFITPDSSETKNFSVASMVIPGKTLSRKQFMAKLREFRDNIKIRNHTMGFRICCSAKCQEAEETQCVSEVFPGIPVLGLEAHGEIGWDFCEGNRQCLSENHAGEPKPKRAKRTSGYPEAAHYWSTVLVFLSWD